MPLQPKDGMPVYVPILGAEKFMVIIFKPTPLPPVAMRAAMGNGGNRVGLIFKPALMPISLCEFSAREGFTLLTVPDLRKLVAHLKILTVGPAGQGVQHRHRPLVAQPLARARARYPTMSPPATFSRSGGQGEVLTPGSCLRECLASVWARHLEKTGEACPHEFLV